MHKVLVVVLAIVVVCGSAAGCSDKREPDEMAYAVGIGLDKGPSNLIKMTLQFAVPVKLAGEEAKEGSLVLKTVEAPNIYSGINMFNSILSKQVNLSHAKVLIFSKQLAEEGVEPYINEIIHGREFRPGMYLTVTRESAEDYLKAVKPSLGTNPAKHYELKHQGYMYTGFSADTRLYSFYLDTRLKHVQAVAALSGVHKSDSPEASQGESSTYKEKGRSIPLEGDFKAGDIPVSEEKETEIMGLAVFDGMKMVGEMDGEEATYYLMAKGDFKYSRMSIPQDNNEFIVFNISQHGKPNYKLEFYNGKPQIKLKIDLNADILSKQRIDQYSKDFDGLEAKTEEFLKEGILRFLNRTKDLGVDICGFGGALRKDFYTWKEWEEYNWLERYEESGFDLDVNVRINTADI